VADPSGPAIGIWRPGTHQGAQIVNEPSTWAMSMPQTPESEAAEAFYGALFGWKTEDFGDGVTLWRLPGYVGG
jgi:uncharacterized protein